MTNIKKYIVHGNVIDGIPAIMNGEDRIYNVGSFGESFPESDCSLLEVKDETCAGCLNLKADSSSVNPKLHDYPYCSLTSRNLPLTLERSETCKKLNQKITK